MVNEGNSVNCNQAVRSSDLSVQLHKSLFQSMSSQWISYLLKSWMPPQSGLHSPTSLLNVSSVILLEIAAISTSLCSEHDSMLSSSDRWDLEVKLKPAPTTSLIMTTVLKQSQALPQIKFKWKQIIVPLLSSAILLLFAFRQFWAPLPHFSKGSN